MRLKVLEELDVWRCDVPEPFTSGATAVTPAGLDALGRPFFYPPAVLPPVPACTTSDGRQSLYAPPPPPVCKQPKQKEHFSYFFAISW